MVQLMDLTQKQKVDVCLQADWNRPGDLVAQHQELYETTA